MPILTNGSTAPHGRSVGDRLARLLDTPNLARIVPQLAPETLHQLVQYRGLEACGELVTSATPAQLTSLLELDLWRPAEPGQDQQFDLDRFGDWLEVLVDTGDSVAARTVAALDKELVIVGLCGYLRVFDPGTFEPTESTDDEPMDRNAMMHSEPSRHMRECEVGGYLVRARRADAWDAIVALLVTLETEQNHYFHPLMQGCRHLSHSSAEIDGLDDLLRASAQHLLDAQIEREARRSRQGYAAPADARAFLQMARQPRTPSADVIAINPIARAYFRAVDGEADIPTAGTSAGASRSAAHPGVRAAHGEDADIPASILELLAEAGVLPERPRALIEAANDDPGAPKLPLLRRLMEFLQHQDEAAYLNRSRELAFLANTLLAGSSVQSRTFTPREASDAAACVCNLGLEAAIPHDAFLVDHDLVTAFEVGWSVLYKDVSLFVVDQLMSTIVDLRCGDPETRRGLRALRRTLAVQRKAGTPWLARDAAEVLSMLDMTAWISVIGLLDECPILPASVTAVLERRTTAVNATAFEFISTAAQVGDIRVFMTTLPGLLSG